MSPKFLTAEWRKLAMANYSVAPQILKKYLPEKTVLDTWNETCYVSLVGFMFLNTKVKGIPVPFHQNFEEVNLRFYVKHNDNGEWKRGVVFIKEIVPRAMLSFVANTLFGEHYITLPMQHRWEETHESRLVEYQWGKNLRHSFNVIAQRQPQEIETDSEVEFITEHYWGYTQLKEGRTSEYRVEHPRWKIYEVKNHTVKVDFGKLYGEDFAFLNEQQPLSVFLAEGSEIIVREGKII